MAHVLSHLLTLLNEIQLDTPLTKLVNVQDTLTFTVPYIKQVEKKAVRKLTTNLIN